MRTLIAEQFPEWADLEINPVIPGGWDNKTFRLGQVMTIRLPTHMQYSDQVKKEHYWLPELAPKLPLPIATPLKMGHPGAGYPFYWSIYKWLDGETASNEQNRS